MPKEQEVVVVFACDRRNRIYCSVCSARASVHCRYKLRGKKAGSVCGKYLCGRCAKPSASDKEVILCPGHKALEQPPTPFDPTKGKS